MGLALLHCTTSCFCNFIASPQFFKRAAYRSPSNAKSDVCAATAASTSDKAARAAASRAGGSSFSSTQRQASAAGCSSETNFG